MWRHGFSIIDVHLSNHTQSAARPRSRCTTSWSVIIAVAVITGRCFAGRYLKSLPFCLAELCDIASMTVCKSPLSVSSWRLRSSSEISSKACWKNSSVILPDPSAGRFYPETPGTRTCIQFRGETDD